MATSPAAGLGVGRVQFIAVVVEGAHPHWVAPLCGVYALVLGTAEMRLTVAAGEPARSGVRGERRSAPVRGGQGKSAVSSATAGKERSGQAREGQGQVRSEEVRENQVRSGQGEFRSESGQSQVRVRSGLGPSHGQASGRSGEGQVEL